MLTLQNLAVDHGKLRALWDVSLHVGRGERVGLLGANGAGKSTAMGAIVGLYPVAAGTMQFDGAPLAGASTTQTVARGIALVPEGRHIFPAMTVEENLVMGTIPVGEAHLDEDRAQMFELFPRLQERRNQRAGTLSGGEQQMLANARALMSRPQLILLDEPSLGLAPLVVRRIFEVLREIASLGKTIFLVEQNANHALKLADRAYVLVNGEIRLQGSGRELLADPEVRKAYLGGH